MTLVGLVASTPEVAADEHMFNFDPRMPRIARINFGNCDPTCKDDQDFPGISPHILFTDAARRRIYAYAEIHRTTFPRGIAVIDPDRKEQTAWIDLTDKVDAQEECLSEVSLCTDKFSRIAYDEENGRLFLGETADRLHCERVSTGGLPTSSADGCAGVARFAVVDLTEESPTPQIIDLPTADVSDVLSPDAVNDLVEGDSIESLAYDAANERLYLLMSGGRADAEVESKGMAIVAYDAAQLDEDSEPLWVYRFRACPQLLPSTPPAQYFAAANDGSFLYFACRGPNQNVGTSGTRVGGGVMRVNLTERVGGLGFSATEGFSTEFFPLAGNLKGTNAFSMFDAAGERLGIGLTGGGAQRLYVFDARHRAWVGALVMGDTNVGTGAVDAGTGRMYVFSQDQGLRYIDAAALPPVIPDTPITLGFSAPSLVNLAVDPVTRRVAIPRLGQTVGPGESDEDHLWLYEDHTPAFVPAVPTNPDDQTHDIEEAEAAQVSHVGFGSAYGAHAILVRGLSAVPLASLYNSVVGGEGREALVLDPGDRGLFLSHVSRAELSGERDHGVATASAAAAKIDDATEADLRGKYSFATTPPDELEDEDDEDAEPCDQSAPGAECLTFDALKANVGELKASSCNDFGNADDPRDGSEQGSQVECRSLDTVSAFSSASAQLPGVTGPVSVSVADSESFVRAVKDPDGGVVTTSTAVVRGVTVSVPGAGTLTIGHMEATATARANGRPGGAWSEPFRPLARNVRIVDDAGEHVFACGTPGTDPDGADPDAQPPDECDPADVALAINRYLAPRVEARGARQDLDELTTGSPGGAQAIVRKDPYAGWNDKTINGDNQDEVHALQLTIYNDSQEASRVILKLAAVYAEAQYKIGDPKAPDIVDPTKLSIALADDAGEPLAGGLFQVREADALGLPGLLAAACTTSDDGVGDCEFDDIPPGEYVIAQTAAPAGYAPADDATIFVQPGMHTEVTFTNLRAVGRIGIALTDDGGETGTPSPLSGATFAVLADDGDLVRGDGDEPYDECVTDPAGECVFEEVPLGAYVVYQTTAPDGYLTADDVGFVLELPGQTAALAFVTGVEGVAGTPGSEPQDGGEAPDELPRESAFVDEPTETTTVTIGEPPMRPAAQVSTSPLLTGPLARIIGLPSGALGFLRRQPLQAVLFGLVWLLMAAPAYLAVRRRTLTLAKEVM